MTQYMGLKHTDRTPRRLPGLVSQHIQPTWLYLQAFHSTAPPLRHLGETGSMSATLEATLGGHSIYQSSDGSFAGSLWKHLPREKPRSEVCVERLKPILPGNPSTRQETWAVSTQEPSQPEVYLTALLGGGGSFHQKGDF